MPLSTMIGFIVAFTAGGYLRAIGLSRMIASQVVKELERRRKGLDVPLLQL